MTDEMNENDNTTNSIDATPTNVAGYDEWYEMDVKQLFLTVLQHIDALERQQADNTRNLFEMKQKLQSIMVGWNAFLKSAEAQFKALFQGNIPAPLKRKLIQTAFKGMEEAERKGK